MRKTTQSISNLFVAFENALATVIDSNKILFQRSTTVADLPPDEQGYIMYDVPKYKTLTPTVVEVTAPVFFISTHEDDRLAVIKAMELRELTINTLQMAQPRVTDIGLYELVHDSTKIRDEASIYIEPYHTQFVYLTLTFKTLDVHNEII